MALNKITIQEGQSLYDVAMMYYGTLDELFTIFVNNPDLDINSNLEALSEVVIDDSITGDEDVKRHYVRTTYITNNDDGLYVPLAEQKQFNDLTAFDFNDGVPFQFNDQQ